MQERNLIFRAALEFNIYSMRNRSIILEYLIIYDEGPR